MARIAVVDVGTGSTRAGNAPRADRDEAIIVSLAGEEAQALRAECANGRLVINVAGRPFKVWRGSGARRQLVLTGEGPGEEDFDTSGGPYEVTIEAKAAR